MADNQKQQLAQQRTDWAWQRNLLAEQRNFAAWVRTGLAALAVGFAVVKLFGETEPVWIVYAVGSSLIGAGMMIHLLAFVGYFRMFRQIRREHLPGLPIWSITLITLALLFSGAVMLILMLAETGLMDMYGYGFK